MDEYLRDEGFVRRFWAKVDRRGPDECWPWLAGKCNGYGSVCSPGGRASSRHLVASRVSWALANGPIPEGMYVRHRCDNPPCCNPRHLLVGTQGDNVRDMWDRGRAAPPPNLRGDAHPATKISDAHLTEIRQRWESGESMAALGREYGVVYQTIQWIVKGRRVTLDA